jgi:hypothetical protein
MQAKTFMMIAFLLACSSFLIVSIQAQNASSIFGMALKYDRDPLTGNFRDRGPVFGAEISLEGPQGPLTTSTDGKGAYRFPGLAEGKYWLTCKPPEQFVLSGPAVQVVELPPGVNTPINFVVHTNGKINGHVFSANGIPAAGMTVDLLPVEQKDSAYPHAVRTASQTGGTYGFSGIPPGRFLLGIRLDSNSNINMPYPRTYYDGATEPGNATVLELQEGQKLENIDLRLPAPLQARTISGMVQSNGTPAVGAWVSLQIKEYPNLESVIVVCNTRGRFSARAFAGLRYSVFANNSLGRSTPIEIPALGDADVRLDLVPVKGPLNLLLKPDASQNSNHGILSGGAMVEGAAGHDSCFSFRNPGAFRQDILLPPEAEGKYAVLLGQASSENINRDGVITGPPSLYGYMMSDPYHIVDYLQGQKMVGSEKVPNKWGPVYGIFMVPPGTTRMRFFLFGSASRFDDLGLYLLPTMPEAVRFVQNHFNPEENTKTSADEFEKID